MCLEPLSRTFCHKSIPVIDSNTPVWDDEIEWTDIYAPFDEIAVRVRVFDKHGFGEARFIGQIVLNLSDCESEYGAQGGAKSEAFEAWHKLLPADLSEVPARDLGSVQIVAHARRAENQVESAF